MKSTIEWLKHFNLKRIGLVLSLIAAFLFIPYILGTIYLKIFYLFPKTFDKLYPITNFGEMWLFGLLHSMVLIGILIMAAAVAVIVSFIVWMIWTVLSAAASDFWYWLRS